MAKHKLLVIDDSMATAIISNVKIGEAIPPIKQIGDVVKAKGAIPKVGGCGRCRPKARNVAIDIMHVKKTIAQLSEAYRIKLKELLDTHQIRIVYRTDSNKLIQLTF